MIFFEIIEIEIFDHVQGDESKILTCLPHLYI